MIRQMQTYSIYLPDIVCNGYNEEVATYTDTGKTCGAAISTLQGNTAVYELVRSTQSTHVAVVRDAADIAEDMRLVNGSEAYIITYIDRHSRLPIVYLRRDA